MSYQEQAWIWIVAVGLFHLFIAVVLSTVVVLVRAAFVWAAKRSDPTT